MTKRRVHRRGFKVVFASVAGLLLLLGGGGDSQAVEAPQAATPKAVLRKAHVCAACHGGEGVSGAEIFPNLAGQQKDYTIAQLTAFRGHTRADRDAKTYMWGMAAGLDDAMIAHLADYYAAKPAARGQLGAPAEIALGEKIFKQGVMERGVLACASCHGEQGAGNGAVPRLAGQQRDYLAVQLRAFSSGARENAAMNLVAKNIKPDEIKAVAAYLASL
jgi:cytochrome c553